jgi:hypothetical protein
MSESSWKAELLKIADECDRVPTLPVGHLCEPCPDHHGFGIGGTRFDNPGDLKKALGKAMDLNAPAVVDIATADYAHFKMRT